MQATHAISDRRCFWVMLAIVLGIAASPTATTPTFAADTTAPATGAKSLTQDDLTKKRDDTAKGIAQLTQDRAALVAKSAPAEAIKRIDDELELLESLDLVHVQHLAALDEHAEIDQDIRRLGEELASLHTLGPAEPKPYSYLTWDEIRDQWETATIRRQSMQADTAAEQLLQAARAAFEHAEHERHMLIDAAAEHRAQAEHDLHLAELRSKVADATVMLRRAEVSLHNAKLERTKRNCEYLAEKKDILGKQCTFSKHDFESRLALIAKAEEALRSQLRETERLLQQHEREQKTATELLKKAGASQDVIDAAIDSAQIVRRGRHEEITLLNQRLGEFPHYKHVLTCRHDFVNHTMPAGELAQCRTEMEEILTRQQALEATCARRVDEYQTRQSSLVRRLHELDATSPLRPWLTMQQRELNSLIELFEASLVQLRTAERSLRRFLADISPSVTESTGERLKAGWQILLAVWNYELETVDDRPITIGKIVGGLLYFIVGLFLRGSSAECSGAECSRGSGSTRAPAMRFSRSPTMCSACFAAWWRSIW